MPTFSIDLLDVLIILGVGQGFLLLLLTVSKFQQKKLALHYLAALLFTLTWFQPEFLDMFAQRLVQYKELDKAIAVYQYNQELFPDEDFTYANLANAYFLDKKKKMAQSFAEKALEKNEFNTLGLELNRLLAN